MPGEGIRLGTVRRPPRGVRKTDFARRDYYDVWLPELAPSAELLSWITARPIDAKRWAAFRKRYEKEMSQPPASHALDLLAALSEDTDFSVGCYCEDESHCHRSVLREILLEHGARMR